MSNQIAQLNNEAMPDMSAKVKTGNITEPLINNSLSDYPWQVVGSDFIKLKGRKYLLLVCADHDQETNIWRAFMTSSSDAVDDGSQKLPPNIRLLARIDANSYDDEVNNMPVISILNITGL